jgi:hypothetical protein
VHTMSLFRVRRRRRSKFPGFALFRWAFGGLGVKIDRGPRRRKMKLQHRGPGAAKDRWVAGDKHRMGFGHVPEHMKRTHDPITGEYLGEDYEAWEAREAKAYGWDGQTMTRGGEPIWEVGPDGTVRDV